MNCDECAKKAKYRIEYGFAGSREPRYRRTCDRHRKHFIRKMIDAQATVCVVETLL
jgi:hypothetical protein